jgi:hypothetical protein
MRRLVLPTLAIATSMMLVGAPLTSSAADYLSADTPPTGQPDTRPTASNYSGKMQTEQNTDPNTRGTLRMSPDWLRQSRIEFPDQVETGHPGMLTYRPDPWSSGPVKMNMTLIERVRQRIEQAFPYADISVMANADKGVITLMGLVATKEEKKRAHELVAHTKGVTEVHDELQVSG